MFLYDRINKRVIRLFKVEEIGMYIAVKDKPLELISPDALKNMLEKGVLQFLEY